LLGTAIINLVFLISYTYRYDPPPVYVKVEDPMDWLKETVFFKGFTIYVPPPPVVYDPWEIRMKYQILSYALDLLTIFNAVASILAFILK
jgi:hypothetical protein